MTEIGEDAELRPASPSGHHARRHGLMLVIACAIWTLAFLLHELPDGRVALRVFPQVPLPQACASRAIFGLRCAGCGLTRSIIHLAKGDWQASWHDHRLGGLFAMMIAFQIPYRLYALIRGPERPLFSTFWLAAIGYALVALLIANWLVDVAAGRLTSP
jgi:hypothetical protein